MQKLRSEIIKNKIQQININKMKKSIFSLLFACLVGTTFAQKKTTETATIAPTAKFSGTIEYEMTMRLDVEQLKATNPEMAANIPDVINMTEKLIVNNNMGRLERDMRGMMGGFRRPGQAAPATPTPEEAKKRAQFTPQTLLDFSNNKMYTVSSFLKDSVNIDKVYTEKTMEFTKDFVDAKKTKKILGYNCQKATLKTKDDTYTVWYTTEMGISYSPVAVGSAQARGMRMGGKNSPVKAPEIPTIFIENGVILSIEGTDLGYEAKSIKKDTLPEIEMTLPKDARKVTDDEAAEMRKKRMAGMGWGNR